MSVTQSENKEMRHFEKICEIIARNNNDPAWLIPIRQQVQEEYRWLPEEVLSYIATALDIPPAKVYGVASFYAHFALEPKGKYIIRICDGTACHVRGSMDIHDAIVERLGLKPGQNTTDDMMFTLETVSCLGACGLAPAVVINDQVHGLMKPKTTVELIDEIIRKENEND